MQFNSPLKFNSISRSLWFPSSDYITEDSTAAAHALYSCCFSACRLVQVVSQRHFHMKQETFSHGTFLSVSLCLGSTRVICHSKMNTNWNNNKPPSIHTQQATPVQQEAQVDPQTMTAVSNGPRVCSVSGK